MISPVRNLADWCKAIRHWELRKEALFVFALWAVIVIIRMLGPYNLIDQDQERPAAYMMDVLCHNEWIVQRDVTGDVSSKPPLYTWLGAIVSLPFGTVNRFTLYFPCMLSVLLCALLILWRGGLYFGRKAGFWGAIAFTASLTSAKMVCLARTDPLFMLTVFAMGLTGFECWSRKRDWANFWLLGAFATLTKGPLGIILGAMGLLAILWERLDKRAPVGGGLRLSEHLIGLISFIVLSAGWFWLAVRELGQPVIDKMIGAELERHIVIGDAGEKPLENFFNPLAYFITRFIPWSLFSIVETVAICKAPSRHDNARRFERFCIMALFGAIFMFGFAGHKRPDHLFPLLPFGALLAGRALAWLTDRKSLVLRYAPCVITVVVVAYTAVYYTVIERGEPKLKTMEQLYDLAMTAKDNNAAPLVYMSDPYYGAPPYAMQYFLGDMTYEVTSSSIVRMLNSKTPVLAAIRSPKIQLPLLRDAMTTPSRLHVLAQTKPGDADDDDVCHVAIISNQPQWAPDGRIAFTLWDLDIVTSNAKVRSNSRRQAIAFEKIDPKKSARVGIANHNSLPKQLRITVDKRKENVELNPNESWSMMIR